MARDNNKVIDFDQDGEDCYSLGPNLGDVPLDLDFLPDPFPYRTHQDEEDKWEENKDESGDDDWPLT